MVLLVTQLHWRPGYQDKPGLSLWGNAQMSTAEQTKSQATRKTILNVAAAEIYQNGFRSTGLNEILSKTGLTKGAFYHHFRSKAELGLAVAQEIIDGTIRELWIKPLQRANAGVEVLQSTLQYAMAANNTKTVSSGCPLCNLAQEMANQDENICAALRHTLDDWLQQITNVLKHDQEIGRIRSNVDCEQSAYFILSSLQGAIGLAKPYHSPAPFRASMRGLIDYLDGLKTQPALSEPTVN